MALKTQGIIHDTLIASILCNREMSQRTKALEKDIKRTIGISGISDSSQTRNERQRKGSKEGQQVEPSM